MEPPSELEQKNAALLAEQAALKRKVTALEDENAVLKARRVLLERRLAQTATDLEVPLQAKGPGGPSDPIGSG
jgi:regulator of replication initiation timing